MTKHNMQIFGVSLFFKLQNSYKVNNNMWDIYLLLAELFCCDVFETDWILF